MTAPGEDAAAHRVTPGGRPGDGWRQRPPTTGMDRRALLTIGTAVLLSGCGTQPSPGPPGQGEGPSPSASAATGATDTSGAPPSGSGASPAITQTASTGPSPAAATPGVPQPGVCPPGAGVIPKPGTQQYLPCSGRDIALTIDDGPDSVWTPQVLALLDSFGIKATFCMIGENAARRPRLVAAVAAGGHQIANHTYTHPLNLPRLTRAQIDGEIHRTQDLLTKASDGHRPALFRAPGGAWSAQILASSKAAGLRALDWSVDTKDWTRPGVRSITEVILTRTHPGSIILDHDGGGDRSQTVSALKAALPRLIEAGYHFVLP